ASITTTMRQINTLLPRATEATNLIILMLQRNLGIPSPPQDPSSDSAPVASPASLSDDPPISPLHSPLAQPSAPAEPSPVAQPPPVAEPSPVAATVDDGPPRSAPHRPPVKKTAKGKAKGKAKARAKPKSKPADSTDSELDTDDSQPQKIRRINE
ncbi:nuclear pore complex-interacting protein-like 3-like, partial [Planoprotostelium fungivorum]